MSRLLIYFKAAVIRRNLHKQTACSYKLLSSDENTNNSDENHCGKQFKNLFLITASIFGLGLYIKYNNTNIGRKNVEPNKLLEKFNTLNEYSTFTNCSVFRTFIYYISNSFNIFPKVNAATRISNSNVSLHGNRQKYNFIADVVSQVAPSVVYIEIKDTRRVDFFTGQPMTASNGSGFIVREDGLILTNAHVVINKPNSRVDVRLQNGTVYTGTVESVDSESDLATVRIPCKGLNPLILGKSSNILPGEWVVAIGSPLTLSNTVTAGVISSTDRGSDELGLRNKSMTYIQTDAAITFGNSGGPLVNLDGEVIGINSMKVTAGISFAIPSDYANDFLTRSKSQPSGDSLIPKRRYVGITMLTLTPEIVTELRQRKHSVPGDVTHGVLVWKVILGSPAHSGGLQPGDIVTHINGDPVKSAKDIYKVLSDSKTRVLKMSVVRSTGLHTEVTVTPES